jgi:hypothetical protein
VSFGVEGSVVDVDVLSDSELNEIAGISCFLRLEGGYCPSLNQSQVITGIGSTAFIKS